MHLYCITYILECEFPYFILLPNDIVLSFVILIAIKYTPWILRRDEPLVHIFVDILLITKHVLDHDVSLES